MLLFVSFRSLSLFPPFILSRRKLTLVSVVLGLSVGGWSSSVLALSSSSGVLLGLDVVLVGGLVLVLGGELGGGLLEEIHCCGVLG